MLQGRRSIPFGMPGFSIADCPFSCVLIHAWSLSPSWKVEEPKWRSRWLGLTCVVNQDPWLELCVWFWERARGIVLRSSVGTELMEALRQRLFWDKKMLALPYLFSMGDDSEKAAYWVWQEVDSNDWFLRKRTFPNLQIVKEPALVIMAVLYWVSTCVLLFACSGLVWWAASSWMGSRLALFFGVSYFSIRENTRELLCGCAWGSRCFWCILVCQEVTCVFAMGGDDSSVSCEMTSVDHDQHSEPVKKNRKCQRTFQEMWISNSSRNVTFD